MQIRSVSLAAFLLLSPLVLLGAAPSIDSGQAVYRVVMQKGQIIQTPERMSLRGLMDLYKTPGLSLVVTKDLKTVLRTGYGRRVERQPGPVLPDTIFQAGSVSKLLTALMVLRMVEKGRLNLEADVNSFLKTWKLPKGEFATSRVTLAQLLSHRAGLSSENYFDYDRSGPPPSLVQVLEGKAPAKNKPAVVLSKPGSDWAYSNIGYAVLQLVIEDVTGKPFAQVADEVIFDVLGMDSSTFRYPLPKAWRAREALPHDRRGKNQPVDLDPSALSMGGLLTTPSDLAKLNAELMQTYHGRSEKIISKKMFHDMLKTRAVIPASVFYGISINQGLGIFTKEEDGNLSYFHPGHSAPGSTCLLVGFPRQGDGLVVMSNGNKGDLVAIGVLAGVADAFSFQGGHYFRKTPKPAGGF